MISERKPSKSALTSKTFLYKKEKQQSARGSFHNMSVEEYFGKLFQNNSEGESSGPIIGHLPDWFLAETNQIIYNGPVGRWDHPHQTVNNWFDGLAILTSFQIDGPQKMVHMRKRFLKSEAFMKAEAHGKLISTEYGTAGATDPDKGMMSKLVSSLVPGDMTDNCACNVIKLGGGLVTTTETCLMRRIDEETLVTKEKIDLSSLVNISSGRALKDPITNDVYNVAGSFLTGLKYHFIKFPYSEMLLSPKELVASASVVSTIPSRMNTCFSYYHSFGMTDKYLIMIEQPWVANSLKLATSKVKGTAFYDCLDWYPGEKNVFHVVDKESGKQINKFKYMSKDSFFFLNFINCFEEDGHIVVDLVTYDSPKVLDQMYLEKLRKGGFNNEDKSIVTRYVLPIIVNDDSEGNLIKIGNATATLTEKKIVTLEPHQISKETGCEHPTINRKFTGKKYNFAYVIGWMESVNRGHFANALTKVDMETGSTVAWRGNEFCHPAEAIFIPRTKELDDGAEDDGLVVASVTETRSDQKDFLVFLDARTMAEIGRVNFDDSIPFGSHAYLSKYWS